MNTVANAARQTLSIAIVSDTVCPWCYVGKRRLEKALKTLDKNKVNVQIEWFAYQLDPTMTSSVNKLERYYHKFGKERCEMMLPQMLRTGKEEGINFSYGGKIGNTLNSHRLIAYAYQQGGAEKQNAMVDKLFNLYFECEQDIADMDVLIKAGEQVGLTNVREFLHSDVLRAEVQKQIRQNQQEGITGVPHFTFNGQYGVSGAQNPETFVSIFKRLGIE